MTAFGHPVLFNRNKEKSLLLRRLRSCGTILKDRGWFSYVASEMDLASPGRFLRHGLLFIITTILTELGKIPIATQRELGVFHVSFKPSGLDFCQT